MRRGAALVKSLAALATMLGVVAIAATALAEPGRGGTPLVEGPSARTGLLRVVLGLGGALVLAVLAAHPIVRRIERRLGLTVLLSTGLPFVAMGVVFHHPSVGILSEDVVNDLRPALEFGLGWLGFVVGMQFDVRALDQLPEKTGTVVFAESVVPLLLTFGACALALFGLVGSVPLDVEGLHGLGNNPTFRASLRHALALGACAAPAAPVAAVALARSAGSASAQLLARITALNDVAGVFVMGIICAFFRPTDDLATWRLPEIAWLLVTLGLGGVLGILTYILVRGASSRAEEMALLLGSVALSAGMAGYLGISPLVACAIAGALLTNLPNKRMAELREIIVEVERPLYLIFLLVAGALWDPSAWQGWALVPVFVLARVGGKLIGAHLSKRTGPADLPDAGTLGLALAPQSPISIATIVGYFLLYKGGAQTTSLFWLMTTCIGGALLTELTVQAIARIRGGLTFDLKHAAQPSLVSISPLAPDAHYEVPSIPLPPQRPRVGTDPGMGGESR